MATTNNDITGDPIKSKVNTDDFRNGWDAIWNKKDKKPEVKEETKDGDKK